MTSAENPPAGPEMPALVTRTVERLVRAFFPERIILFGSYAKGTTHARSDVDLLVIAYLPEDRRPCQRQARQLAADCFPPVDVVLATPQEVEGASAARSPFLQSILGTGFTVYARTPLAAHQISA